MERINEQIIYTKEDEQGFSFFPVPEEEKKEMVMLYRKKRKKHIVFFGILLLPAILVHCICRNADINYFVLLYDIIVLFWFGMDMFCYQSKLKGIQKEILLYIEVELLKKLPIESERVYHVDTPSETYYFYPIIGKDTTSGYEALCFVEREQYENSSEQAKIKIIRSIKGKKKKEKKND
ncbi:MAG: hypothetical protein NC300_05285 [Bacteroidales bacterium]|nr:hypothetical protein [Clostridium sp.]MCM1203537.1 hypothetical protein [Bacteroidales bacterium]